MEDPDLLGRRWVQFASIAAAFALPLAWRIGNREMAFAPANVELITAGGLFLALVLAGRGAAFAPLVMAMASDAVIGNSTVAIFTWSAWLVTGIAAARVRGLVSGSAARGAIFGAASSTWFFLWTNFGVWLLSAGRFYSVDLGGLVDSYVAGLPFYRNMLVCNVLLCPVAVVTQQFLSAAVGDPRTAGGSVMKLPRWRAAAGSWLPSSSRGTAVVGPETHATRAVPQA